MVEQTHAECDNHLEYSEFWGGKYIGQKQRWYLLEFFGDDKLITGVVLETNYDESMFRVDSYENIYNIHINIITKILNNTKFKYNLNKLNNIDFL